MSSRTSRCMAPRLVTSINLTTGYDFFFLLFLFYLFIYLLLLFFFFFGGGGGGGMISAMLHSVPFPSYFLIHELNLDESLFIVSIT